MTRIVKTVIPGFPPISARTYNTQQVKRNIATLILLFALPDAKARLERLPEAQRAVLAGVLCTIGKVAANAKPVIKQKVRLDLLRHMPQVGSGRWHTFDPHAIAVVLGQLIGKDDKGRKAFDCERAMLPALAVASIFLEEANRFDALVPDLLAPVLPDKTAYHPTEQGFAQRALPDSPTYLRRSRELFWAGVAATAGAACWGTPTRAAITIAAGAGVLLGGAAGVFVGSAAVVASSLFFISSAVALEVLGRRAIRIAARGFTEPENALIAKGRAGPLSLQDFYDCFDAMAQMDGVSVDQKRTQAPQFTKIGRMQKLRDFTTLVTWFAHARVGKRASAWPDVMHAASMALMNRLQWKPHFVHLERLDAIRQAQRAGEAIIFVIHHTSDLDTPAMLTVVGEFNPQTAAKDMLSWTPAHGRVATIHPKQPSRWGDDASMADCLLVDRQAARSAREKLVRESLAVFASGRSVAIFGQGTRQRVKIPGRDFGSGPYKTTMLTIAEAAAQAGKTVRFVPIHLVGTGSMMSSDYQRLRKDGLGEHLPVVVGIGEPITFQALQQAAGPVPEGQRSGSHLTGAFWLHCMRELIPLQRLHEKMVADAVKSS